MQQFSAYSVFSAGVLIESVRMECYLASTVVAPDGKPGFAMMLPIDGRLRDKATRTLESLENDCKTLALKTSAEMVAKVRSAIEQDAHRDNVQWLLDQMKTVRDLMSAEMKRRVYAYIPAEKRFTKRFRVLEQISMRPVALWRSQGRPLQSSTLCEFLNAALPPWGKSSPYL